MRGEGNHKIPGSFAPENMEKTGAERVKYSLACQHEDAIPIKFVPYAQKCPTVLCTFAVALRKESVDRNVGKAPYMENAVVRDCWKQGFVTVKRLDDVDNVGAYLTAYLGDMELSEASKADMAVSYSKGIKEVEYEDENGVKQTKKYIKGARLCMYPPGFHIFRWSKGIKKPDVSVVEYKKAKEKASSGKLTFTKTVALEDPESDFKNTLQYEYYNSMRK